MSRWEDWQRTRHDPDTPPDQYQQSLARKVLGELMEGIQRSGLFQNKITRRFADGTVVVAQYDGTTPMVQVIAPAASSQLVNPTLASLWIPRGFVFVPGNADAPQVWGLPVQQAPDDHDWPFGTKNLTPGLDVTRWTAGGPAAQVLLTADATTRYPNESKQRLPIGYDSKEWRAGMAWMPKPNAWHVVRPTFDGFDWTPNVRGARIALWKSVTTKVGKSMMALPFAGYYDDAQVFANLSNKYGADDTHWPLDYATTTVRANKDGYRGAYSESRYANGTPQQLADGLTLTDAAVQIDVGVAGGITTATERTAKDWIRCGNVFWHPNDAALPTLTWDGYPAQNLPFWLVEGGWTGDVGSAVFPLEGWNYQWRGQTRYVYSKNLYAMGRCIGVLPDTVIAAAIRRETVPVEGHPGRTKQVNRVVVITWRADDQFGNASGIAYLWKFRVWCVDFDVNADVPLHVTDVPVGAYDATTNPKGWRACGTFNVWPASGTQYPTTLPDNTFWQMPRFNGDGTKAVAAYGIPPYAPDVQFPLDYVCSMTFSEVAPDTLSYSTNLIRMTATSSDRVIAADFDADDDIVWISEHIVSGAPKSFSWSGGGSAFDVDYDGAESVVERWALDARTGAMATLGHFIGCSGPGAPAVLSFKVRLAYQGVQIDAQTFADTIGVYEPDFSSDNWLDRLNVSFARDRSGHYAFGYDLGVTKDATPVYVTWPVCGSSTPSTTGAASSWFVGSRWLFDGEPMTFLGLPTAPMRAFPIGVC